MGDMGDTFNMLREASKKKRASNRSYGVKALADAGVNFEVRNLGAHLIVSVSQYRIDYYPGTGLWVVRGTNIRGRGINGLLDWIKANGPATVL